MVAGLFASQCQLCGERARRIPEMGTFGIIAETAISL